MTSAVAPTAASAASVGWRLGALYGPAVYGVSAAAVALPAAADGLHTAPATAAWILTIHALGLGVGAAVAGRATDVWGHDASSPSGRCCSPPGRCSARSRPSSS